MSRIVKLEELTEIYGSVLDPETIKDIHGETRGVRSECYEQLTMLSGIEPPLPSSKPHGGSSAEGQKGEEEGMGEPTLSQVGGSDSSMLPEGSSEVLIMDYDAAVATGEEKAKLDQKNQLSEMLKRKAEDVHALFQQDLEFQEQVRQQVRLGPQSCRSSGASINNLPGSGWAHECFKAMIRRETEHCGEFVCFYHSYSFAALLYEVQACIARVIYGLPEDTAPMARLLKAPFRGKPHISVLLENFKHLQGQDHDSGFREVAISCSVSLLAPSSEAPPTQCFQQGYSCNDLSFHGVLMKVLKSLDCSDSVANKVADNIADVGVKFKLFGELFKTGSGQGGCYTADSGHMLQIFVRTDCVDDIAYGSQAYGVFEPTMNPLSEYLTSKKAPDGQGRIFWHPALFFDPTKVKVYHYAANKKHHGQQRLPLQRAIQEALKPLFDSPEGALKAYYSMEGWKGIEAERGWISKLLG